MKRRRVLLITTLLAVLALVLIAAGPASAVKPMLAAGLGHTVVLKSNGQLWAWGDNSHGQLGDGTTKTRLKPKRVGSTRSWKRVACGGSHTLAIAGDGTLWAWGMNNRGQLGLDDQRNRKTPTRVSAATNWVSVNANLMPDFRSS